MKEGREVKEGTIDLRTRLKTTHLDDISLAKGEEQFDLASCSQCEHGTQCVPQFTGVTQQSRTSPHQNLNSS